MAGGERHIAAAALGLALLTGAPAAFPSGSATRPRVHLHDARAAIRQQRLDQAEALYRTLLESEPLNDVVYEALVDLAGQRHLTSDSAALNETRRLLPPGFAPTETARFIVLSDAAPQWTLAQAQRLERTYHQFLRFTRRLGLRPRPLKHKLVCVLFRDRGDYQSFAAQHDDVDEPWIAGYYAPRSDRIVFYPGDANPSVVEAYELLAAMDTDVSVMTEEVADARRLGQTERARTLDEHRSRYQTHVTHERNRVAQFAERVSTATTIHEAVHQLLFHTGVQTTRVPYPMWISEGLATAFEAADTDGAFGPDHEFAPRRAGFAAIWRDGRCLPLRRLVSMTETRGDEALVAVVYHQAYALLTWMARFRKYELRRYLELMLVEPAGTLSVGRHVELFEQAFGDVEELERAWQRHESRVFGQ